jgi:vitamin B12 transporter
MPAFLRFHSSAALAGRRANRKQVNMKIIQQLHRKGFGALTLLWLSFPGAETAWADASAAAPSQTSPVSASASSPGKAATAGKSKIATGASTSTATASQKQEPIPTPQSPAAATPPPTGVTTLPTIVVTAPTRESQPIDTTATTTTVLDHQYLEDNKFVLVSDALQMVPGLAIVTTGNPGGNTSVFSHGLNSNETLLTIDGRRQPAGLDSTLDNLGNLTLDNIDQIEIVRSPVTAEQGGGAMGGVINIVTLSGRGLTTPESSVSEEAGSFNSFRESAQSRGQVENFDYAVAGSRQDSIYPALSTGSAGPFGSPGFTGQADQYRNSAYRGNFGYQVTPDIYVDLHSSYNNAYTSSTGPFADPDPTASLLTEDWFLSPEVVAKVTDFYSTKLYYTHDQYRQAYNDPYSEALFGGSGNITRAQIDTDSVDWQNDFQLAHNWSVTAGLQGDNRNYHQFDNGTGLYTFQGHNNNIGSYILSQWQPLPGLNVLSSGRYDSYSQFGGAFTWRQGVAYTIAPTQTVLHASVSRAYTPPSIQSLYLSFPDFGYFANPNLRPETDLGWEAGVAQPLWDGRVEPSVTYFHNNVKNIIIAEPIPGTFNTMEENVDRATTDGVEIGLTVKTGTTVSANVNYTYLNAVDNTDLTRLPLRPRNSLNFTGTWNPVAPLTLTLGGSWVVDRQDGAPPVNVPDYFVLRATATYRISNNVSIWVRGENLTDRNYQPAPGYYAPSMAGYGGVKVSF